jgi:hypothetical protein
MIQAFAVRAARLVVAQRAVVQSPAGRAGAQRAIIRASPFQTAAADRYLLDRRKPLRELSIVEVLNSQRPPALGERRYSKMTHSRLAALVGTSNIRVN